MQVLKFGGTSVLNADNINKMVAIVQGALPNGRTAVVVSAFGGITDTLLSAAVLSAEGNEAYKEKLQLIEQRHLEAVKALLPITQQSSVLSMVKKHCNEMESINNILRKL